MLLANNNKFLKMQNNKLKIRYMSLAMMFVFMLFVYGIKRDLKDNMFYVLSFKKLLKTLPHLIRETIKFGF